MSSHNSSLLGWALLNRHSFLCFHTDLSIAQGLLSTFVFLLFWKKPHPTIAIALSLNLVLPIGFATNLEYSTKHTNLMAKAIKHDPLPHPNYYRTHEVLVLPLRMSIRFRNTEVLTFPFHAPQPKNWTLGGAMFCHSSLEILLIGPLADSSQLYIEAVLKIPNEDAFQAALSSWYKLVVRASWRRFTSLTISSFSQAKKAFWNLTSMILPNPFVARSSWESPSQLTNLGNSSLRVKCPTHLSTCLHPILTRPKTLALCSRHPMMKIRTRKIPISPAKVMSTIGPQPYTRFSQLFLDH